MDGAASSEVGSDFSLLFALYGSMIRCSGILTVRKKKLEHRQVRPTTTGFFFFLFCRPGPFKRFRRTQPGHGTAVASIPSSYIYIYPKTMAEEF
jgi:hypothetical protein